LRFKFVEQIRLLLPSLDVMVLFNWVSCKRQHVYLKQKNKAIHYLRTICRTTITISNFLNPLLTLERSLKKP